MSTSKSHYAAPAQWFRATDPRELGVERSAIRVQSTLHVTQSVLFTEEILDPRNDLLAAILDGDAALLVTSPSVDRLYGAALRSYLEQHMPGHNHRTVTLNCGESSKTIEKVLEVCHQASAMKLGRRSRIVAIGGGVCTDICGFAAAIYCRGVSHIKVPTTLLGLIDAGIGMKNGANLTHRKNGIGTFYPPEYSLLDPGFIRTLDARQVRSGMAESIKIAITSDRTLFETIEQWGPQLLQSRFAHPGDAADLVIRSSVERMLEQLTRNPYEVSGYERVVDFGHTLSPYFESASRYELLHGEAVALDVAISVGIARRLSLISDCDAERILSTMNSLGLLSHWPDVDSEALWRSLTYITAHRNGRLNLVVPVGIGEHAFVNDLSELRSSHLVDVIGCLKERYAVDRRSTVES